MVDVALLSGFLAASVRVATPLGLAAIGETIVERSGVINLGIEGAMLAGAFAAGATATVVGPGAAVAVAAAAGLGVSACFAVIVVPGRADQIIAGTAVTLGAIGATGLLAERRWGPAGAGLSLPMLPATPFPGLGAIPILGDALFRQSVLTYLCIVLIAAASVLLFRTAFGLRLRAAGEAPHAAAAAGVPVGRIRTQAILIGGICAGLAGASLVLAQVGTFTERMTAGRGFIAIAVVALGRWRPWWVGCGALLFGMATALQYLFQASGSRIPYQLFQVTPYLLALLVMAISLRHQRGPAALGQSD